MVRKCAICGASGTKGFFRVPNSEVTRGQWQNVISEEVTESHRVCFRHFSREDLEIRDKVVYPKKGKFSDLFPYKTRPRVNVELLKKYGQKVLCFDADSQVPRVPSRLPRLASSC